MEAYFKDDLVTIYQGDSREVMKTFPENSIDTILTDPPYGLKFMGKDWDHGVPGVPYWAEALRVAKPGAFLLAFGGTRTYHRLACAIEDAGWEIRDDIAFLSSLDEKEHSFFISLSPEQQQVFLDLFASQRLLLWVYGSGFPKSHNISKALDKAAGAKRKVIGYHERDNLRKRKAGFYNLDGENIVRGKIELTSPATEAAQTWHGWGTALKPAWEPIIVAMKPLDKNFVNNALTWGVAGLNIDGSRVGAEAMTSGGSIPDMRGNSSNGKGISGPENEGRERIETPIEMKQGRWPANIILDEQAAEFLDEQSGVLSSGNPVGIKKASNNIYGQYGTGIPISGFGDSGGASRFFYTAKASTEERGEGNNHPTVKPEDLMKYLCKLTATPSGGIILDPFMGSGTTLKAARVMGRQSIGIDIEINSCRIAVKRLQQGVLNFKEYKK